jgi:2-dehydropantoate 2-reductase
MDDLIRESCEVARKQGVDLDPDERIEYTKGLLSTAGGRGSMAQDILLGRRTEIDTINGAVLTAATKCGVDAPLNKVMVSLVKGREAAVTGGDTSGRQMASEQ